MSLCCDFVIITMTLLTVPYPLQLNIFYTQRSLRIRVCQSLSKVLVGFIISVKTRVCCHPAAAIADGVQCNKAVWQLVWSMQIVSDTDGAEIFLLY